MSFTAKHAPSSSLLSLAPSCLDVPEGDTINPGAALIGTDKVVGVTENVRPIDLIIQGMEAAGRFLFGLAVELPL